MMDYLFHASEQRYHFDLNGWARLGGVNWNFFLDFCRSYRYNDYGNVLFALER